MKTEVTKVRRYIEGGFISAVLLWGLCLALFTGQAMADTTSPPSTFTGYVKGFQNDLFSGTASMSIPIGTGGPSLGLGYSSGVVDEKTPSEKANWVGLGWSLSGLGSIRKDKDGKFYANGGGVSGELIDVGGGQYKTRTESFALITHTTSPSDYWTVTAKNGVQYRFGYNSDSEWQYDSWSASHNPDGNFQEWLLDQIQDTNGNAILIRYNNYTDQFKNYCTGSYSMITYTREVLPKEVVWNYRSGVRVGHDQKVSFNWGSRTDYDAANCGLGEYSARYKLDSVDVWIDLNDSGALDSGERIRRYEFAYDYSTGGLTLISTVMKGTDGITALPATTFSYTNNRLSTVNETGLGGSTQATYAEVPDTTTTQGPLSVKASAQPWSNQYCSYGCMYYDPSGGTGPNTATTVGTTEVFGNYQTAELTVTGNQCHYSSIYNVPVGTRNVKVYLTDGTHDVEVFSTDFDSDFSGTLKMIRKNDGKVDVYWNGSAYRGNVSYPYTSAKLKLYAYSSGSYWMDCCNCRYSGFAQISTGTATASFKGRYRVASATANDGMGNASTTSYAYASPSYSYGPYSEFRGFRTTTATDPDTSKTVTYFLQGDIYKGLVEKSYIKNSSNLIYIATTNTYDYMETNNGNSIKTDETLAAGGVYFPRSRYAYSYSVEGATADESLPTGTYKRSLAFRDYDTYGNVTEFFRGGDSHDMMDTQTAYLNDTSSHILGVPCQVIVKGYNKDNAWVTQSQSKMYYDGYTTSCSQSVPKGNLTRTDSYKDATTFVTVTMGYDTYGNLKWTTDAKGNTGSTCVGVTSATSCTDYDTTYNALPVKTCNANNFCSTVTYDSLTRPIQVVDINGQSTYTAYDVFGRVTAVAKPLDSLASPTVQTVYDDTASLPSYPAYVQTIAKDGTADGLISYTFVDGLGRTIQTKSEGVGTNEWYTVDTYYNAQGRLDRTGVTYTTTSTTPTTVSRQAANTIGVWTVTGYDPIGRVNTVTKPDTSVAETSYGQWVTCTYDELDHLKCTYVDGLGRVTKVEDYTGAAPPYALYATTTFQYNSGTGQVVRVTDPEGNVNASDYDWLGRKTMMDDRDMGLWTYAYDANGNLTSQTDAKNQTITFTYDKLNRLTLKDYPGGYYDMSYTYDVCGGGFNKGKVCWLGGYSGGNSAQYFEGYRLYDERGRLKQSNLYLGTGLNWYTYTSYDSIDRVSTTTYPDGEVVTYRYNKAGKLDSPDGGTTPAVQSSMYSNYAYVKDLTFTGWGSNDTVRYGNGVSTYRNYYDGFNGGYTEPTSGLKYTYHPRILYTYGPAPANAESQYLTYDYDKTGNVKGVTNNLNANYSSTYTYDDLNRLTAASAPIFGNLSFSYDSAGNLLTKDGRIYVYPAAGATSVRPHAPTSDGTNSYTYDNNGNMATRNTTTFQWDYDNMLKSVDNGTIGTYAYASGVRVKKVQGGVTTYYVGNIYEVDSSNNVTKYYYANGQRIAKRFNGTVSFIHSDHLGSASATTDANGNPQYTIVYKPYGEDAYSNAGTTVHYKFTGKEIDSSSGLYYYGARYYDPRLGRFISADSVEGPNRYAYVGNNPVNRIDPTGHFWKEVGALYNNTIGRVSDTAYNVLKEGVAWYQGTMASAAAAPFCGSYCSSSEKANMTAAKLHDDAISSGAADITTTGVLSVATMGDGVALGLAAKAKTGWEARKLTMIGSGLTNIGANRAVEVMSGGKPNWNQAPFDFGVGSAIGLSNTYTTQWAKEYPLYTKGGSLQPLKKYAVENPSTTGEKVINFLLGADIGEKTSYQYAGTTALWMSYAYVKGQMFAGGKFPTLDRIIPSRLFTLGQMMVMTAPWQTPIRIVGGALANAWMSYMGDSGSGPSFGSESVPSWTSQTIKDAIHKQGSTRYQDPY